MNSFYWLMKREFWENRGGFLWAPIITGGVFILLNLMAIIAVEVTGPMHGINIGDSNLRDAIAHADAGDLRQIGQILDVAMLSSMGPISICQGFVVFFYCLSALYDDRRDRSVLFWKSLPISDTNTVLSKVASAVVVAPVIAVATGIVTGLIQLIAYAITLSFHGVNIWQLLGLAHPIKALASLIASVPAYALWALPAVGWLMLCSAWARSKPFLWAVATPAIAGLLVGWFGIMGLFNLNTGWFWTNIVGRMLVSVFPVSSIAFDKHSLASVGDNETLDDLLFSNSFHILSSHNLWIGVLAGVLMLAAAVWFRRVRDDS
ncbi:MULTISPECIES: hypothetical protein [Dyella]|uniref:Uncharacterized protein n=2 Tax=Dyella TaxID=231454 RepID=A0A4R0YUQ5_9GAMM|nr:MULTISPECIES: hypothetical protein [Dyella]TBR39249.1 hypothetical protein EYV96_03175 [Dyella terrae]TCI13165.1 hypothetical protein EZM97_07690 [Dyella soli]